MLHGINRILLTCLKIQEDAEGMGEDEMLSSYRLLSQRTLVLFPAPPWRFTIVVSGDLTPSSSLHKYQAHTHCTYIHTGKILISQKLIMKQNQTNVRAISETMSKKSRAGKMKY